MKLFIGFLIASLALTFCDVALGETMQDRFRDLEEQFQQASTTQQYAVVAAGYEALTDDFGPSPSLLFNSGNAWFQAEEFGRAIANYNRALRLAPRDTGIRENLALALKETSQSQAQWSAIDYAFFWKDRLTVSELALVITTVVLLFAMAFAGLNPSPLRKTILIASALLLTVLFVSFGMKVSQEQMTRQGVVIADTVEAKKGPAPGYDKAFSTPLRDGQLVVIIDQEDNWVRINIDGTGQGWLPKDTVTTF